MIKELKLEKMDRSEMKKVEAGDGIPAPTKCEGCLLCGTKKNDESMNTNITE